MTPRISGTTRIIAHIGVPTESFRAPLIYNPYFADRGIDVVVVPMGCEAADFPAFLPLLFRLRNIPARSGDLLGLNIQPQNAHVFAADGTALRAATALAASTG